MSTPVHSMLRRWASPVHRAIHSLRLRLPWFRERRALVLAVLSGLVSAVLGFVLLGEAKDAAREAGLREAQEATSSSAATQGLRTRSVVVAQVVLAPGTPLSADWLALRSLPSQWLSEEHLDAAGLDAQLGKFLRREIRPGDPIRVTDLERPGQARSSPDELPPGHRLLALQLGVGWQGILRDGDLVDLYEVETLPSNLGDGSGIQVQSSAIASPPAARLVVSAVRVRHMTSGNAAWSVAGTAPSSLLFEIPNGRVSRVLAAQSRGQLNLALRSPSDIGPTAESPAPRATSSEVEILLHQTQSKGE